MHMTLSIENVLVRAPALEWHTNWNPPHGAGHRVARFGREFLGIGQSAEFLVKPYWVEFLEVSGVAAERCRAWAATSRCSEILLWLWLNTERLADIFQQSDNCEEQVVDKPRLRASLSVSEFFESKVELERTDACARQSAVEGWWCLLSKKNCSSLGSGSVPVSIKNCWADRGRNVQRNHLTNQHDTTRALGSSLGSTKFAWHSTPERHLFRNPWSFGVLWREAIHSALRQRF